MYLLVCFGAHSLEDLNVNNNEADVENYCLEIEEIGVALERLKPCTPHIKGHAPTIAKYKHDSNLSFNVFGSQAHVATHKKE